VPRTDLSRARFYLARARAMPPGEWAHRARQAALAVVDRRRPAAPPEVSGDAPPGWPRPAGGPALVEDGQVEAVRAVHGAVEGVREAADRILAGRYRFFGTPEVVHDPARDWNHDPVAGASWPLEHWSRVNHRDGPADPKWVWELGRHQALTTLARAWRLTGHEPYAEAARRQLRTFLEQAPPEMGIHWRSGLELGIRLISWAWTVEFLRGWPGLDGELRRAILAGVAAHLRHLERYPSRYSSANNHLVGEAAGMAVGGLAFPEAPGAAAAAARGLAELTEALDTQVLPDGVDAEQAVGYHGFVLDLGLAAVACLRRLERPVPDQLRRPLVGIAAFMGTLASDAGTLPRIGDEDEGLGVDLGTFPDEAERLWSRLRSAEALLGIEGPRREPGLDEQSIWLAGVERAREVGEADRRRPGSAVFPQGGYVVLRDRDYAREMRAVLDAGPLGLPPLNAHGHADLLAVCLSVDGEEVLVDPGTFTYFGERRWRDYGRSTAAHSTVRVDGRDQVEPTGRFMWASAPAATLDAVRLEGEEISAAGHHLAYAPVRHERRVGLRGRLLTVEDRISGPEGEREIEVRWHLGPGTVVEEGDAWRWHGRGASVLLRVKGLGRPRVVTGDEAAPLGFVSTGLERREPAPALVASARARLPAVIISSVAASE
jgi:heparinase II/III-like protein